VIVLDGELDYLEDLRVAPALPLPEKDPSKHVVHELDAQRWQPTPRTQRDEDGMTSEMLWSRPMRHRGPHPRRALPPGSSARSASTSAHHGKARDPVELELPSLPMCCGLGRRGHWSPPSVSRPRSPGDCGPVEDQTFDWAIV